MGCIGQYIEKLTDRVNHFGGCWARPDVYGVAGPSLAFALFLACTGLFVPTITTALVSTPFPVAHGNSTAAGSRAESDTVVCRATGTASFVEMPSRHAQCGCADLRGCKCLPWGYLCTCQSAALYQYVTLGACGLPASVLLGLGVLYLWTKWVKNGDGPFAANRLVLDRGVVTGAFLFLGLCSFGLFYGGFNLLPTCTTSAAVGSVRVVQGCGLGFAVLQLCIVILFAEGFRKAVLSHFFDWSDVITDVFSILLAQRVGMPQGWITAAWLTWVVGLLCTLGRCFAALVPHSQKKVKAAQFIVKFLQTCAEDIVQICLQILLLRKTGVTLGQVLSLAVSFLSVAVSVSCLVGDARSLWKLRPARVQFVGVL